MTQEELDEHIERHKAFVDTLPLYKDRKNGMGMFKDEAGRVYAIDGMYLIDGPEYEIERSRMFDEIRKWGVSRGLTGPNGKATVDGQLLKLDEEHAELEEAISLLKIADEYEYLDYKSQTQDAIGDMTVVLVLLADLLKLRFEDCVQGALDVISKRTGTMVNGVFVKQKGE